MRSWYLSVSTGAFLSKVLGVAREALLASSFGTGPVADAFRASLGAALSPAHLVANRIVQAVFIPLYAGYGEKEPAKGRALFLLMLLVYSGLGLIVGLLLMVFARPVVGFLLPGFGAERAALAVAMLRIIAAGLPFYTFTALLEALGVAQKDFVIPSLRPGLQNLGLLAMIVAAAAAGRPVLIAYGFTASYVLLSLVGSLFLLRRNRIPRALGRHPDLLGEVAASVWRLARPLVVVSILVEVYVLGERYLASLVGDGAVASVEYARFVTETANTLLIMPLGLIGLGHFSTLSRSELDETADANLAGIYAALVPISAFLFMNGEAVLRILYMRGRFDADSLTMTRGALQGLSIGLWAHGARYFLQRVSSARLRNDIVLYGESLFALVSLAVMIGLFRPLGVFGLGLGTSAGAVASWTYYLGRTGTRSLRARRVLLSVAAATPVYLLLSWLAGRLAGGAALFVLQIVVAILFWSLVAAVRPELRDLVRGWLARKRPRGGR